MIVPPFFGLYIPSKDRTVHGLHQSYLSADTFTYTIPTNKITLDYATADILSYNLVDNPLLCTYLLTDALTAPRPVVSLSLSWGAVDVLTYDLPPIPPSVPSAPYNILALDGDGIIYLSWLTPQDNGSFLTDYVVEYKNLSDNAWIPYNDTINVQPSATVDGLVNNTLYQFRIAAINSVGTGLYGLSDPIMPTAGVDDYCTVKLLIQPNTLDISAIQDLSCFECDINQIGIEGDNIYAKFGLTSIYFDGETDLVSNPSQFPYFSTAHHLKAIREPQKTPQDYWSLYDDFTIEFWIRPALLPTNNQTILSVYSQEDLLASNLNYYKMYLTPNNRLYWTMNISYYDNLTESLISQYLNMYIHNINLSTIDFSHIAVVRSKGYIRLFVNGVERAKEYFTYNVPVYTDYMIIGADHTRQNYIYDQFNIDRVYAFSPFVGNLDDILISKAAKYRRNFVASQYLNSRECGDCLPPGAVTNLLVSKIDGV